ncbi:MAG TPA: dienelactone hydrolase family protein [Candidatus Binataceae bacterium]|nr:dienelactone hydrolase family protein [Candidatus Binataceae bacterium]
MRTETVDYNDGEVTLRGYLAYDETQPGQRPGVLVMPGGFGLGRNAKDRAEMLARMGYVALAGDPYGGGIEIDDLKDVMKRVTALRADTAQFRRRARVALDRLIAMPQVDPHRVAAIGYCLGGTFVLELARDGAPLAGVVTFHGGLETKSPAAPGTVKAKLLILTGADDPTVPVAHLNAFAEEMTRAGADWQIVTYSGTKHGFTYPDAASRKIDWIEYKKSTDERSWSAMRSFFEEIFRTE